MIIYSVTVIIEVLIRLRGYAGWSAALLFTYNKDIRLAPVLNIIFHQCVITYTCSQSNSDGSVLRHID